MARAVDALANVRLRPEAESDLSFLLVLYRSTREQEVSMVPWTEGQKQAFVEMQFTSQRQHYLREYPGARLQVIERDAEPIGRLYVHERPDEIRIMEIALAPAARSQGVGGALLRSILDDGARSGRPVTIHVERFNPARRLYERLGFRNVSIESADSIYLLMEARPRVRDASIRPAESTG